MDKRIKIDKIYCLRHLSPNAVAESVIERSRNKPKHIAKGIYQSFFVSLQLKSSLVHSFSIINSTRN